MIQSKKRFEIIVRGERNRTLFDFFISTKSSSSFNIIIVLFDIDSEVDYLSTSCDVFQIRKVTRGKNVHLRTSLELFFSSLSIRVHDN